ncbi:MAG: histidinol-phosphate aminotransferase family protein [Planctomycetes bacterium]|nr:histidinol-phosphate aminotransferase family protein [Planctomycetota bacterium]
MPGSDRVTPGPQHAFHGGASFDAIGTDFGDLERRHQVVDADVLDAWYEPAPAVLATLRDHLAWLVKTSPPTHGEGLRAAIAARHGLAPAQILLGGGTSSLMYTVFPQLVGPGDTVAILDPMYGEYHHIFAHVLGTRVVPCELDAARGFAPDAVAIADTVRRSGAKLLVMVNPNSPTGVAMPRAAVETLLAELPATVQVWIDETYVDFAPEVPSAEPLVAHDPRVMVAKSMSKFFALSGLRVGYLCADGSLVQSVARRNPPWSVGLLAQCAAVRALDNYGWYRERAAETHLLRAELMAGIDALPELRCMPSTTNFVLIETTGLPAGELVRRCRAHGVFLRDCGSLSPRFGSRYVRTAVKARQDNRRIVAALAAAGQRS